MGRGATKPEGGMLSLPLRKGDKRGAEKVLVMLKVEGHKKILGSFYAVARSFSHIEGRGAQKVSTL